MLRNMGKAPSSAHLAKRSRRSDPLSIVKLLDRAEACERLSCEMNFAEHRSALLAMAAQWRKAAEVARARNQ